MNVFLTGATGGIGRRLVELLAAAGHQPLALTRRPKAVFAPALPVRGDLLDPASYAQALHGADAVVHLAAVTHSPDPDLYYAVNARGTELLLAEALKAKVRRFVFVGTRAVGKACGAYGESKALAEEAVRKSPLDWTIARPAEVYGASDNEAVSRLVETVRRGWVVPCVTHPKALLAPVHLDDVAQALVAMLSTEAAKGKTYVLAGPEEMPYPALVDRLMRHFARRRPRLPVPVAALGLAAALFALSGMKRPPLVRDQIPRLLCPKDADISQAARDLGFAPRTLEAGLPRPG